MDQVNSEQQQSKQQQHHQQQQNFVETSTNHPGSSFTPAPIKPEHKSKCLNWSFNNGQKNRKKGGACRIEAKQREFLLVFGEKGENRFDKWFVSFIPGVLQELIPNTWNKIHTHAHTNSDSISKHFILSANSLFQVEFRI